MTLEYASQICQKLPQEEKREMFSFWVQYFDLQGKEIVDFAIMSGYLIAAAALVSYEDY